MTPSIDYQQAGVNIDEADRAVASIRGMARRTFTQAVLTDIGSFGGGYALKGYRNPVLVSSADVAKWATAHGFTLLGDIVVDGYDRVAMPRQSGKPAVFGVLDMSGVLEITDPERFLAKLRQGFGRARAFGCGLMLIRRVS